jgi:hypothetical protein
MAGVYSAHKLRKISITHLDCNELENKTKREFNIKLAVFSNY